MKKLPKGLFIQLSGGKTTIKPPAIGVPYTQYYRPRADAPFINPISADQS